MAEPAKRRVRGSTTGRPIMVLLDLLGRRWTLRIIWELRKGPLTSRALRQSCGDVSPTVLQARLGELRAAGLVSLTPGTGYGLTELGVEMGAALSPLLVFSERWSESVGWSAQ
jgi:DNA-binding HxlR family transcriptional regulator